MTKNRRAKDAARGRQERTGEPYVLARRLTGTTGSGQLLQQRLGQALRERGWPVVVERTPQADAFVLYGGPLALHIHRAHAGVVQAEGGPDVEGLADLPLRVTAVLPFRDQIDVDPPRGWSVHMEFDGEQEPGALVSAVSAGVIEARLRAVQEARPEVGCGICSARFPARHLMPWAADYYICPACVLDQDLSGGPNVAQMTAWLDHAYGGDPAFPAGWSAFMALIATVCPTPDTVKRLWDEEGDRFAVPLEHWADPGSMWIWLGPDEARPAALRGLGAGASLSAVVAAVDAAHPDLRESHVAELVDMYLELDHDEQEARARAEHVLNPALWAVVIAYAVAFGTQATERGLPATGDPYNVVWSFEGYPLGDLIGEVESHYSYEDVEMALGEKVQAVARAIGFRTRE